MSRLDASQRKASATFTQKGQGARFPMPDKEHARLALQMLPRAKNMPAGAASKVRARAAAMLSGAKQASRSR